MDVLISYDVDKNSQSIVKKALIEANFKDVLTNGNDIYNLPNTTLVYEKAKTAMVVSAEFNKVINELNKTRPANENIIATRFVACGISISTGIEGDQHAELKEGAEIIEASEKTLLTLKQKKDLCLLYLYNKTKESEFRGSISVYDAFHDNSIILEQTEINLIVHQLKESRLIASTGSRGAVIYFDSLNKGIDFIEETSFASPGTSILTLY